MSKKVCIVHGWEGYPGEGWFPWLKQGLEARGFEVIVPQMPGAEEPRIAHWVPALREAVGVPDQDTYLVGHSMGCQAIARFLEGLPEGVKIGGAVFVAGFFKSLSNIGDDPVTKDVEREWLATPLDLEKVRSHLNNSTAIFSDNDPYVPLDNQDDYRDKLGSKIIVEHNQLHFSGSTDTLQLPVALEAVLSLAG